mgnify:CR=1 FL=1
MPEPPEIIPTWAWTPLVWIVAALFGVLSWVGKQYIQWRGSQIGDLREDLEDMREEMREEHRSVEGKLDRVLDEVES